MIEGRFTDAEDLLKQLVNALDGAFISSWQSTHYWQKELDAAKEHLSTMENLRHD